MLFGPDFQENKIFHFNFLINSIIYLSIFRYLFFRVIKEFIFEHMLQEILWNNYKTHEQIQGTRNF